MGDASRPEARVLVFGARDDELVLGLAPFGRGRVQVTGGVRLRYRAGGD